MSVTAWREKAQSHLGVTLGDWTQLSGGDFAQSYRATVQEVVSAEAPAQSMKRLYSQVSREWTPVAQESLTLEAGEMLFIKTHSNPPLRHFSTEALGLRWLQETGAVHVPEVLGVDDALPFLAMKWVAEGSGANRQPAGEAEFGRQLAKMHQASCRYYGRVDQRSTGSLGLPNKPCQSWSEFYASQRLIPLLEIASAQRALPTHILQSVEKLVYRLDQFAVNDDKPSRLHGDLWAGNRLLDASGRSWVIDPACHGGSREFDLAMMRLFGGFDASCHAAYQEMWPLADGWRERIQLHQLAPLIVHAIKFGTTYVKATEDALNRYT
ncbi:MAG: fructosamine kinase family protein [Granulosicoccus sp.]